MESLRLIHPHWQALTLDTRILFDLVNELPFIEQYYLAGGTGLALHLGHQFSVDLDFFSPSAEAVDPNERAILRTILDEPSLAITFDKEMTFVATWRGVGISFLRLALYPLVQPPLLLKNIPVASVSEIGAMKLAAIIGRGTRKDLVDLFFILQQVSIDDLFQVAAIKYTRVRSFAASATRALAYFEDAERLPMPRMVDRTPWSKMKKFLEDQAMEAGRNHLQDMWS